MPALLDLEPAEKPLYAPPFELRCGTFLFPWGWLLGAPFELLEKFLRAFEFAKLWWLPAGGVVVERFPCAGAKSGFECAALWLGLECAKPWLGLGMGTKLLLGLTYEEPWLGLGIVKLRVGAVGLLFAKLVPWCLVFPKSVPWCLAFAEPWPGLVYTEPWLGLGIEKLGSAGLLFAKLVPAGLAFAEPWLGFFSWIGLLLKLESAKRGLPLDTAFVWPVCFVNVLITAPLLLPLDPTVLFAPEKLNFGADNFDTGFENLDSCLLTTYCCALFVVASGLAKVVFAPSWGLNKGITGERRRGACAGRRARAEEVAPELGLVEEKRVLHDVVLLFVGVRLLNWAFGPPNTCLFSFSLFTLSTGCPRAGARNRETVGLI